MQLIITLFGANNSSIYADGHMLKSLFGIESANALNWYCGSGDKNGACYGDSSCCKCTETQVYAASPCVYAGPAGATRTFTDPGPVASLTYCQGGGSTCFGEESCCTRTPSGVYATPSSVCSCSGSTCLGSPPTPTCVSTNTNFLTTCYGVGCSCSGFISISGIYSSSATTICNGPDCVYRFANGGNSQYRKPYCITNNVVSTTDTIPIMGVGVSNGYSCGAGTFAGSSATCLCSLTQAYSVGSTTCFPNSGGVGCNIVSSLPPLVCSGGANNDTSCLWYICVLYMWYNWCLCNFF